MRWYIAALLKILKDNKLIAENDEKLAVRYIEKVLKKFLHLLFPGDPFIYKVYKQLDNIITKLESQPRSEMLPARLSSLLQIKSNGSRQFERLLKNINQITLFDKNRLLAMCRSLKLETEFYIPIYADDEACNVSFLIDKLREMRELLIPHLASSCRGANFNYVQIVSVKLQEVKTKNVPMSTALGIFKFKNGHSPSFERTLASFRSNNSPRNTIARECEEIYSGIRQNNFDDSDEYRLDKNRLVEIFNTLFEHFTLPPDFLILSINHFKRYCETRNLKRIFSRRELYIALISSFLVTSKYCCTQAILPLDSLSGLPFMTTWHQAFAEINQSDISNWGFDYLRAVLIADPHFIIDNWATSFRYYKSANQLVHYLFYLSEIPLQENFNFFCLKVLNLLTSAIKLLPDADLELLGLLVSLTCSHVSLAVDSVQQLLFESLETLQEHIAQLQPASEESTPRHHHIKPAVLLNYNSLMIEHALSLVDMSKTLPEKQSVLSQLNRLLSNLLKDGDQKPLRDALANSSEIPKHPAVKSATKRNRSISLNLFNEKLHKNEGEENTSLKRTPTPVSS